MDTTLQDKIKDCPGLPSLPTVAVEVLRLARDSEVDMGALADVINQDPALSARVLKTVNSSFYGRSQKVTTIEQALVVMGLQSVKTLVLGFSLVEGLMDKSSEGFDHKTYWQRSFYTACAAKELGVACRVMQTEELFVCGLLSDIGMLILDLVLPDEYGRVCALTKSHIEQDVAERSRIETDHAEVAGYVSELWKLPPVLSEPVRWHIQPDEAGDETLQTMARVVSVASRCADVFVDEEPAQAIADVRESAAKLLAMSPAGPADDPQGFADQLLDKLNQSVKETTTAFEIDVGAGAKYDKILRDATDALVEITMQSQQAAQDLQQKAVDMEFEFAKREAELTKKATTDPMTGLANRAEFDRFLAEELAAAVGAKEPLSLIMADIDKFKSVNDTHGHQVGDAVIKKVAELLDMSCRDGDMAARYGGEEMALILPGTERSTAAALAEVIRTQLEADKVDCGDVGLFVTASFGVSAYEPPSPLDKAALLLKAADKALYHAKETGRNRVKVFSLPRPAARKAA
ncbi:MAG: GGDEF domain-containing protein [Planctomycetota bacterium]